MKMKRLSVLVLVLVIAFAAFAFAGCDKFGGEKYPSIGEIYRGVSSHSQLNGSALQVVVPNGYTVLTSTSGHGDSDIGYIRALDSYIVENSSTKNLSVIKSTAGTDKTVGDLLIADYVAVQAIDVECGMIAVRTGGEKVGVLDANGREVISLSKTAGVTSSVKIYDAIRILDSELIAVNPLYDVACRAEGVTLYTPIYRASTGELACRVYNPSKSLDNLLAFDGKYVTVKYTNSDKEVSSYIYSVPQTASASPDVKAPAFGTYAAADDHTKYYTEATYLGNGKFYVHEEWGSSSTEDYTYYYNNSYGIVTRYLYYPDSGKREQYESDYIFLNMVNTYYDNDSSRCPTVSVGSNSVAIVPSSFLNSGYNFASFALYIPANREAEYDQLVLDNNLRIVYSLTGNVGTKVEGAASRDKIGYYDLLLQFTDGYGYNPVMPSTLKLYDEKGNKVFENKDYDILTANLYGDMIIVSKLNESNAVRYGAFNLQGELVIDFVYSRIEPFRGYYTYAVLADGNKGVLLGRDGTVIEKMSDGKTAPLADIASSSGGSALYKRGCYVYKKTIDGVTYYGAKNFDASVDKNVVHEADLVTCIIYSPNADNNLVFLIGQHEKDGNQYVYFLTGDDMTSPVLADGAPEGKEFPTWAIGVICAGAAVIVAVTVTVIAVSVKKKKAARSDTDEK